MRTAEHQVLTEELRGAYRAWFDACLEGPEAEVARCSAVCQRLEDQLFELETRQR